MAGSWEWVAARNTRGLQKAEAVSKRRKWKRTICGRLNKCQERENNLSRAGELRNSFTSTTGAKIWPRSLGNE